VYWPQLIAAGGVIMTRKTKGNPELPWGQIPLRDRLSARLGFPLVGFVVACGFAAFYAYFWQVIVAGQAAAYELLGEILRGSAESPYAYRVLAPILINAMSSCIAATGLFEPRKAFFLGYSVFCFIAIEFSFVALFRLLRVWFSPVLSLIGIMSFSTIFGVAARDHFFQPWTLLEIGLYAIAMTLAVAPKRRVRWAILLTALAALNRETGLFAALLFSVALPGRWLDRNRVICLIALGMVWASIFCGLRFEIGLRPHPTDTSYHLHLNLRPLSLVRSGIAVVAFISVSLPAVFGWRHAPAAVKRCVLILPLYACLILLFSFWWEVRLWLPIACIFLPLSAAGIREIARRSSYDLPKGPQLSDADVAGQDVRHEPVTGS
jgi:hypothetical protein